MANIFYFIGIFFQYNDVFTAKIEGFCFVNCQIISKKSANFLSRKSANFLMNGYIMKP